jgi:tripartite-type tricarboxylate transporter receptor subunit TctC
MEAFAGEHGLRFKFTTLAAANETILQRLADGTLDFTVQAAHNFVRPVAAGEIRVLGIAAAKRVPFLPDVPTFVEQGFNLVSALWIGLVCRAGTPGERVAVLRRAMEETFSDPGAARAIEKLNLMPAFLGHEQYQDAMRKDLEIHRRVLKALGAVAR